MSLLVVNSEALKCVAKGDFSASKNFPEAVKKMIQQKLSTLKPKEECDGFCLFLYISGPGGKFEAAGCDARPDNMIDIQASFTAKYMRVQKSDLEFGLVACSEDKCNTADHYGGRLMNILNAMKTEAAVLNKPRSTNLICSETGSCHGLCEIADVEGKLDTDCDPAESSSLVKYQVTVDAEISDGKNEVVVIVSCATDNCNELGSAANDVLDKIKKKVEAAVNSSGNISYGFVLAIFISMIFNIVYL